MTKRIEFDFFFCGNHKNKEKTFAKTARVSYGKVGEGDECANGWQNKKKESEIRIETPAP